MGLLGHRGPRLVGIGAGPETSRQIRQSRTCRQVIVAVAVAEEGSVLLSDVPVTTDIEVVDRLSGGSRDFIVLGNKVAIRVDGVVAIGQRILVQVIYCRWVQPIRGDDVARKRRMSYWVVNQDPRTQGIGVVR